MPEKKKTKEILNKRLERRFSFVETEKAVPYFKFFLPQEDPIQAFEKSEEIKASTSREPGAEEKKRKRKKKKTEEKGKKKKFEPLKTKKQKAADEERHKREKAKYPISPKIVVRVPSPPKIAAVKVLRSSCPWAEMSSEGKKSILISHSSGNETRHLSFIRTEKGALYFEMFPEEKDPFNKYAEMKEDIKSVTIVKKQKPTKKRRIRRFKRYEVDYGVRYVPTMTDLPAEAELPLDEPSDGTEEYSQTLNKGFSELTDIQDPFYQLFR